MSIDFSNIQEAFQEWTEEEIIEEAEYRIPRLIGNGQEIVEERNFWQSQLNIIQNKNAT